LSVLVANETVAVSSSSSLDVEQVAQVFENSHLVAVVLAVVFDVLLSLAQLAHHLLLLLLLDLEVLVERFHIGHETFVGI